MQTSRQSDSNAYPQLMFYEEIKKIEPAHQIAQT